MKQPVKFLLLLGPSGAGKSTIIQQLKALDTQFVYISPVTTRPPRPHETDKVFVDDATLDCMEQQGELLAINCIYDARYGTPRRPILDALEAGLFPVLDWPIQRLYMMQQTFSTRLCCVYVEPPDLQSLRFRLRDAGRDPNDLRFREAVAELEQLQRGGFDDLLDGRIVNANGRSNAAAEQIYQIYLSTIRYSDNE